MATITSTVDVTTRHVVRRTWRLVDTDNFGGDYPDERFVVVGIPSLEMARCFAGAWNALEGGNSPRVLHVEEHVEIEYALIPGFEP